MLFLVSLVPFIAIVVIGIIAGVFVFTGYGSANEFLLDVVQNMSLQSTIGWFSGIFVIGFASYLFGVLIRIAFIEVLGEIKGAETVRGALKNGIYLVVPYVLLTFLITLINIGGLVFLLIPSLIFAFLFQFAFYELVFENKRWTEALRESYRIVSQNFGKVLVALFAYYLAFFFIIYFVPTLVTKIDEGLGALFAILMFFVQMLIAWYGVSFHIVLYKHAAKASDRTKPVSIMFAYIIAILGWMIILAGAFYGYSQIKDELKNFNFDAESRQALMERIQYNISSDIEADKRIQSYINTDCGIAIPLLDTANTEDDQGRKWVYEEYPLPSENFYILDEEVQPRDSVLAVRYTYKTEDGGDKNENDFPYSGLYFLCVENTKQMTVDEFGQAVSVNQEFTTEPFNTYFRYIESVGLRLQDEDGLDQPAYLMVDQNQSRLVHLTLWGINPEDPRADELNAEYELIVDNLNYNDVSGDIKVPNTENAPKQQTTTNTATAQPSCTQYNIREGEFASNKCYTASDYDDLLYYLNRYNSSVFSYNSAISQMEVTCSGSDFFKNQCEQATKERDQAQSDIDNYKGIIHGIIARGK